MFTCQKFIADSKSFLEPSFKAQFKIALVSDKCGSKPVPEKIIIILDINVFLVPAEKTIIYRVNTRGSNAKFSFSGNIFGVYIVIQPAKSAGTGVSKARPTEPENRWTNSFSKGFKTEISSRSRVMESETVLM